MRIKVTILILIDGFLQFVYDVDTLGDNKGHNPYFNRWFSAILALPVAEKGQLKRHNPYFNRWFSAIYRRHTITLY